MTTYTDLMIDLETLGTRKTSAIRQIGLVAFNAKPGTPPAMLERQIIVDVDSQTDLGATVDWDTIAWWFQQEQAARDSMVGKFGGESIHRACDVVNSFWDQAFYVETHPKDPDFDTFERVWGHGPSFDVAILENMFELAGKKPRWGYRSPRDTRTLSDFFEAERPTPLIPHIAVQDAVAQAQWVRNMYAEAERKILPVGMEIGEL